MESSDDSLEALVRAGGQAALGKFIEARRPQLSAFIERRMSGGSSPSRSAAHREVPLGQPGGESRQAGLINLLAARITSPSQAFSRDQREFHLPAAMSQLPDESQRVLRLRYAEGLPTKQIVTQLGKSDGAVRVLLTRSIKKLQELME